MQITLTVPRPKPNYPYVGLAPGKLEFPGKALVQLDFVERGERRAVEDTEVIFTLEAVKDRVTEGVGEQSYQTLGEWVGIYTSSGEKWLFSGFGFPFVKETEEVEQTLVEFTLPPDTELIRVLIVQEKGWLEYFIDLSGNLLE